MKQLREHLSFDEFMSEKEIFINIDKKAGDKILGIIDDSDPDNEKTLNNLKSILLEKTFKEITKTILKDINVDKAHTDNLKDIFFKLVKQYFIHSESENNVQKFKELINKPEKLKTNKVFGLNTIIKKYEGILHPNLFYKLVGKQIAPQPVIGPGEAIFAIFTDLSFPNIGDLTTASGEIIEVKGRRGKLKGEGSYGLRWDEFKTKMKSILGEDLVLTNPKSSLGSNMATGKNLSNIYEKLKDHIKNDKVLKEFISNAPLENRTTVDSSALVILKKILKGDKKDFVKWWITLELKAYQLHSGFKYLALLGQATKTKDSLDMEKTLFFINASKSFADIYKENSNKYKTESIRDSGQWTTIIPIVSNW